MNDRLERNLFVTIESASTDSAESFSSTTFIVLLTDDSKTMTDEEWEQLIGSKYVNYPKAFSPTSAIHFKVQGQDSVRIQMFNSEKRFIAELFHG